MMGRSGAVGVEYGLLLPALLVLVLGIIDTGRLLWTQTTLEHAVEAASRCAAVDTTLCSTASQTQTYAVAQAFGLQVATTNFTVGTLACGKNVTASVPFVLIIPWITTTSLTLTATSCYPL
jgi:Flp pilus assembly protein TadG